MERKDQNSNIYSKIFRVVLRGYLWGLGFALATLPALAVFIAFFSTWVPEDSIIAEFWKADVSVKKFEISDKGLETYIVLENNSEFGLSNFEFEQEFYDEEGNFLGQNFVRTMDHVEPGEDENIILELSADRIRDLEKIHETKVFFVSASILSR